MRAAAVRLREPGTVKAPAITGNGMAFARLPSKKRGHRNIPTEQGRNKPPPGSADAGNHQRKSPRRHSQRRRSDHTCNRGRDAHRTAAGTGRGDGQPVGRQHGKPGITRQHAGLPRSSLAAPHAADKKTPGRSQAAGAWHNRRGYSTGRKGSIAGPPMVNGAALLFVLPTGVLKMK